jgi:hypothetical protein
MSGLHSYLFFLVVVSQLSNFHSLYQKKHKITLMRLKQSFMHDLKRIHFDPNNVFYIDISNKTL